MQFRVRPLAEGLLRLLVVPAVFAISASGCFVNGRSVGKNKGTNTQAQTVVVVKPPISNLLVSSGSIYNPKTYLEVDVGDSVEFYWNGSHADLFESTYTPDAADTCPASVGAGTHPWVAASAQGNTSRQIAPCEAGRTYLYTYKVTDSNSGKSSTAYNMVRVRAPTPPAISALLTASIQNAQPGQPMTAQGLIQANAGQFLFLSWAATGVDLSTTTQLSVDSVDACGDVSVVLPNITGISGNANLELRDCMAGHTYKMIYQGYLGGQVVATSTLVVQVRENNASNADPKPFLKLNNKTGSVDVRVGETLNFSWGAENADLGDSTIVVSGTPSSTDCPDDQARGDQVRPWDIRSVEGTLPASTVPACRAGKTYTLNFLATQSSTGRTVGTTITVNFLPAAK